MGNNVTLFAFTKVLRKEVKKGRFYYDPYVYYEQAEGESYYGKLFFARVRKRKVQPTVR